MYPFVPKDAVVCRPPELPGVELIAGPEMAPVPRHDHEAVQLGFVRRGAMELSCRGGPHLVSDGEVGAVEAGDMHFADPASPKCAFLILHLPPAFLDQAAEELGVAVGGRFPGFRHTVFPAGAAAPVLMQLERMLGDEADGVVRAATLMDAVGLLLREHAEARPRPAERAGSREMVRRMVELIEDDLSKPVTLDQLAEQAGRSKFHLLRVFRDEVGLPPHAYQMRARLLRARELLDGGTPVARAALETGFADQAHLTRHFKRLMGVTPGRYARNEVPERARKAAPRGG